MKRIAAFIISLVLGFSLSACSGKHDTLKFVRENVTPARMQCADFEVNIGNEVGGAKIIAELWQDGACTESTPVIINDEIKEIHMMFSVDGFGKAEEVQGLNVQIDTNEKSGSLLTYFELPAQISGYSFTAYDKNEVIEVNPDEEVILAAMAFDTGAGVRTLDCRKLETDPDYLASYSCLLVIRSLFTEEQILDAGEQMATD
ncbi:MAG: hypothetical protein KH828_07985 [Clostridiales bacterium]|nr:hypothetical protein [Clostridiales bacterium]